MGTHDHTVVIHSVNMLLIGLIKNKLFLLFWEPPEAPKRIPGTHFENVAIVEKRPLLLLLSSQAEKSQISCSHLVAACWGGRSASQTAEHLSSG